MTHHQLLILTGVAAYYLVGNAAFTLRDHFSSMPEIWPVQKIGEQVEKFGEDSAHARMLVDMVPWAIVGVYLIGTLLFLTLWPLMLPWWALNSALDRFVSDDEDEDDTNKEGTTP